ncbi:hypothetical protein ACIA7S_28755 [Streptomyces sp. NPDC051643]|uniref:hypothetical protein n=1 Tax=Streptomyces sp. NPDC051643 TaxID=3365665 RepID=UPI0037AB45B6
MTVTDTTPGMDWLAAAEAEDAAHEARVDADSAKIAAAMADELNKRLAEMGITPAVPATSQGGDIIPALLVPADPGRQFYGVHATVDEDEGGMVLLASDYREGGYEGLRRTYGHFHHVRSVLVVRRSGPIPEPAPAPQLSPDAQAIVRALGRLADAVGRTRAGR